MSQCPIPANEEQRLAALHAHRILDTAPEPEFDVTTRVAAHLFDTPIALVALMDRDRLWFKSRHGLDLEHLDREIAFCAHAIVNPDRLMVIEDLRGDPRFAGNPLVAGAPGLRFYAGAPLRDAEGHALGTLAVLSTEPRPFGDEQQALLRDLSVSVMTALESRRRALELRRLATTDALTGLANRVQFQSALALELRQARLAKQPVALLYLDLDGFKAVNDRLGHGAGDAVLGEVARRLVPQLRAGETLARLGGDEFGIVMRGGADATAAVALAERLADALHAPVELAGGERARIGVSVGIAVADAAATEGAALLEQADHALHRAKAQAGRRWHVHAADTPAPRRPAAEAAASGAGDDAEPALAFSMAFQPIVAVGTRSVFAYEALVRGPGGEPAASVLAQVNRRNRYRFDAGTRQAAIAIAARLGLGPDDGHARLAINFIPGAMPDPEFALAETVAAAKAAGIAPERLILEVTEGEEVLDPAHLAAVFAACARHGVAPAIDDFGAGHAGLNLLARFRPAFVKLDRRLTEDVAASRAQQAVVRAVLGACTDLGIGVVAEGVQTAATYETLRMLGVDLFQGWLFAKAGFESLPPPHWPD
jgi:diguanylate cyclase (GGDEF)-like protein